MASLLIFVVLMAVVWAMYGRISRAVIQWRENPGEVQQELARVHVPIRSLDPHDPVWQVTSRLAGREAHVAVEHPVEGPWHEWTILLGAPHAQQQVESALSAAESLRDHLNGEPGVLA